MVYCARYTHQQRSEMEKWTIQELDEWAAATDRLVQAENRTE